MRGMSSLCVTMNKSSIRNREKIQSMVASSKLFSKGKETKIATHCAERKRKYLFDTLIYYGPALY